MTRNLLLPILLAFFCLNLNAQHFCKTDEYAAQNPDAQNIQAAFNKQLAEAMKKNHGTQKSVYSVPVVFHIIHDNGPENIPDSIIQKAVDDANLRLLNAAPYNHPLGHNTNVQLCLASVDPYGNPTTGIVRIQSEQTNVDFWAGDIPMKNVSRWDPHLYLNVWIVRSAGGPGTAYSTVPASTGGADDGIVFIYFGVNGYLLNHEVGHYLGLYHTFHYNCNNNDCSLDGDCVCDTPPDITSDGTCMGNSCSTDAADTTGLSPFTTDVDELPNCMDYSSCDLAFTQGQVDRIHGVLNSVRSTLTQSNGCGQNPGGAIPTASFSYSFSCYNTVFTNTSLNSVGAQWDFNSDGIIDNSGNSVYYSFPANGVYTVTMYAAGYGGIDTIVQQVNGQTPPNPYYPLNWGYEGIHIYDFGSMMFCEGDTVVMRGVPGMQSYLWSNGETTQEISFQPEEDFEISLTATDMNGLSWTMCYPFIVEKAPVPLLYVQDAPTQFCAGDTVTVIALFNTISLLENAWYFNNDEISGFHDTSFTVVLADTSSFQVYQEHVTGCESWSDTLTIISIDCTTLGSDEIIAGEISVYPNPAENQITLSLKNQVENTAVVFYQADGKIVHTGQIGKGSFYKTDVSNWNSGIYYAKVKNATVRFVVR